MKSVSEFFQKDHDRLEELFHNFQRFKRQDYSKAREYFLKFSSGLKTHIVWEEEVLFPVFEQKTGTGNNHVVHVMQSEHKQIKKYLQTIEEKVEASDPGSEFEETQLLSVLGVHNQKEEEILYPYIDRILESEEMDAVFTSIEALPQ